MSDPQAARRAAHRALVATILQAQEDRTVKLCEVSNDCLACPLAACKHDDPADYMALLARRRTEQIRERLEAVEPETGRTAAVDLVAAELRVTPRTVWRALRRA